MKINGHRQTSYTNVLTDPLLVISDVVWPRVAWATFMLTPDS